MNWRATTPRAVPQHTLSEQDPVLARVLAARGVRQDSERSLGLRDLAPLGQLQDLKSAAELVHRYREGRIVIVGDFDADGATSAALLVRGLTALGFSAVTPLVPNRFEFGYGLSPEIVDVALAAQPDLIITVDNGISSVAGVAHARAHGVAVLVTDHHLAPEQLPDADVIVNPNQPGDPYPSKSLAGVGVAFAVLTAVARQCEPEVPGARAVPAKLLDLVALGTVADVVPLDRNNRILVQAGLERIRAGQGVPGIQALLRAGGREPARCTAADLGFAVGPRLNAAGRLDDMSFGIRCLVTDSLAEAETLAGALDQINRDRRELEQDMHESALQLVADGVDTETCCVSLHQPDWHQGVVGLVASRVKDQLHRPVFAFADDGQGQLKGSGRSIRGVHLRDVLAEVDRRAPGLILRFGGHAMAAGLTLAADGLEQFSTQADTVVRDGTDTAAFTASIQIDGELPASAMTLDFAERLAACGPWGQQFPEPLFAGVFTVTDARVVGEQHLKLRLAEQGLDGIAFRQVAPRLPLAGERIELVYRLDINEWRGRRTPQLMIDQWRFEGADA